MPAMLQLQDQPVSRVKRQRPELRYAEQHHKAHGRIEQRQLLAVTVTPQQVHWPHARQVVMVRRQRQIKDHTSVEVAAFITSLSPDQASADDLLKISRDHWSIENRLFHVRDVTFGEDACRIRSGDAPQIIASMRNLAITLMNQADHQNKAAAQRRYAARPDEAFRLLHGS